MAKAVVTLVPWDPESPAHVERMVEQRKQCGWHELRVPTEWKDAHLSGAKCIYWLLFPEDEPQREKYNAMLAAEYPKDKDELVDTGKTLLGQPRSPTHKKFLPIGHISLDAHEPSYTKKIGLDVPEDGSYWIKSLYVSNALQGLGIGSAAMDIAERLATQEPLNARHLLLDTMHRDDHQNKEYTMAAFGKNFKVPTQAWYERRGYRLLGTFTGIYNDPDANGKIWPCRTVYLQRDLL